MKENKKSSRRQKRGVGAIIGGTILAMILFTSVFVYFITITQTQSKKGEADVQAARVDEAKRLETFKATASKTTVTNSTGDELVPVLVDNTGPIPINATFAVVTRVDDPTNRLEIPLQKYSNPENAAGSPNDQVINPGDSALFFVASKDPTLDATKTYHIEILSDRGNIASSQWPPSNPGFTLSAPPSLVVQRGYSVQPTLSIASTDGFEGYVTLDISGAPAGVTVTPNTNPVFVSKDGSPSQFDLLITASPTATLGTFPLKINGTYGSITATITASLTVIDSGPPPDPDFIISASPSSMPPGGTGSSQITITSFNGFNSNVDLSVSGSHPELSVSGPNPPAVTPPVNNSAYSAVSFTAITNAPGTYNYVVTGTGGGKTHTAQIAVTITSSVGIQDGKSLGCDPVPTTQSDLTCANVYAGKNDTTHVLQFYSLKAGTGVTLTKDVANGNIIITSTPGAGGGEANNCDNVGIVTNTGQVCTGTKTGVTLHFRSIQGKGGIVVSNSGDDVVVDGSSILEQVDPKLIQQPQIQAIFPNPFGGTGNGGPQGLWGAVIANPSDHPMVIRKLVISTYIPPGGGSPVLFCNDIPSQVSPTTGWTCVTSNVIEWIGTPINLGAHSAQTFLVQMGNPRTNNIDFPSVTVNYNVYTDFGQFTKVGYDYSVKGSAGNHPIVNAFLSINPVDKNPFDVRGWLTVQQGQPITLKASIVNYMSGTTVNTGANLIIDIPKAFTGVTINPSNPAGFGPCAPTPFADGSTQIKCSLSSPLSGTAPNDVRTIQFTMTAPILTGGAAKEYQLLVLGDGTTSPDNYTVGPVSENVIIVTP